MGALGSDTGGSIRGPAGNCNVVGLKPTYGLVSRAGAFPAAWSLDHVGPLTRTVYDNALMLQVLAGHDRRDPASTSRSVPDYTSDIDGGLAGLRLGIPWRALSALPDLHPEVAKSFDAALEELRCQGARIVPIEIAHLEIDVVSAVYWTILRGEVYAAHRQRLLDHSEDYGPRLRERVRLGALVTAEEYLLAQKGRSMLRRDLLKALAGIDLLVTPTSTQPPKTFAEMDRATDSPGSGLNRIYNLAGVPAISVPCGFTDDGLPLGLQFAGGPFAEPLLYRAAHAYEQATPWHTRHVPLDHPLAPREASLP
jgi:aspartyl-tRNA(Asn)/glutamyl-tRNA(Gln) amidotransferase subunit A